MSGENKNYLIMRNDNCVATVENGVITSCQNDAPILIKKNRFDDWKSIRVQDLNVSDK